MAAIDEDLDEGRVSPAATPSVSESAPLAARYGRTPSKRRRDRLIYLTAGLAAALVVVAWVVWAGLDQAGGSIDAEDKGSSILSDRAVQIDYQVSMPVGSTASCALQVQNEAHGIVGWKIVKVPASSRYTVSYRDVVRSAEQGVTGLIYRCWLT